MLSNLRDNCLPHVCFRLTYKPKKPQQCHFLYLGNLFSCPESDLDSCLSFKFQFIFYLFWCLNLLSSFLDLVWVHLTFTTWQHHYNTTCFWVTYMHAHHCIGMPWSRCCVSLTCADHLPFLSELHICTSCAALWCRVLGSCRLHFPDSYRFYFLLGSLMRGRKRRQLVVVEAAAAEGVPGRQAGFSAPSAAPRDSVLWATLLTSVLLHPRRGGVVILVVTNLGVTFPSAPTALPTSCKKILYSTPCVWNS